LASHRPEEAPNPPGASHHVTSEPLKKEKPYHSVSSPARQSPTQQAIVGPYALLKIKLNKLLCVIQHYYIS